jgi:glycosyltransferase involved in cell wall biosynthesis
MNNANVILHCATQFEGLGSAVIEAMQLRKIVIASDNGGPASFIEHSKNGFLYRSSDIKDLQSNLEHVFREFSGLRNIENQAFQDSYLMFSRETISNQFLGIFQDNQGTNSEVH